MPGGRGRGDRSRSNHLGPGIALSHRGTSQGESAFKVLACCIAFTGPHTAYYSQWCVPPWVEVWDVQSHGVIKKVFGEKSSSSSWRPVKSHAAHIVLREKITNKEYK
eukprot:gene8229-5751_t